MRYLVTFEQGVKGWGASVPGLNVFATGKTREEVERRVSEAVTFHVEGLRLRGEVVPEPHTMASGYVEVA